MTHSSLRRRLAFNGDKNRPAMYSIVRYTMVTLALLPLFVHSSATGAENEYIYQVCRSPVGT